MNLWTVGCADPRLTAQARSPMVDWYNLRRPHQALSWRTPDEAYLGQSGLRAGTFARKSPVPGKTPPAFPYMGHAEPIRLPEPL
jgi:hypothetical protein